MAPKKQSITGEGTTSKGKSVTTVSDIILPGSLDPIIEDTVFTPSRGQSKTFTHRLFMKPNYSKCSPTWRKNWRSSKLYSTMSGSKKNMIENTQPANERRWNALTTSSSPRLWSSRTSYIFVYPKVDIDILKAGKKSLVYPNWSSTV